MKISIITISLNAEDFIENCIRSVLNQSYKNLEFIIIDGGSTDNTLKIAGKYSKNISKIVSEPDRGIYDAMNKGLKIANGEIIGFLHTDDFYTNNDILLKVSNLFKKDDLLDACYSDLVYVKKKDTSKIVRYWKSNKFIEGSFSKGWSPPHPTFFARNSVYKRFGNFNLFYPIVSDVELMMRFLEVHKIQTKYISEVWIKMRLGGLSNRSLKSIIRQNLNIIRALRFHNLNSNILIFFISKLIMRLKQFLYKPVF